MARGGKRAAKQRKAAKKMAAIVIARSLAEHLGPAAPHRGCHCGRCRRGGAPVRSLAAGSVGALALGAVSMGAGAIGALAIGRLAIKRGSVGSLNIQELKVGRLEVQELAVLSRSGGS
jgi:hypothetical protein